MDHDGIAELEAELAMLLEAVARLQDGRAREPVDLDDAQVGAVVEAAIDADRPVDAMDHPHAVAREAAQAREVEVEGVVEAARESRPRCG